MSEPQNFALVRANGKIAGVYLSVAAAEVDRWSPDDRILQIAVVGVPVGYVRDPAADTVMIEKDRVVRVVKGSRPMTKSEVAEEEQRRSGHDSARQIETLRGDLAALKAMIEKVAKARPDSARG